MGTVGCSVPSQASSLGPFPMEPAVQGLQTAVTLAVYVASCLSGLSKGPWNQPLPRDICLSRGLPGLGFRLYVEVAFGKS